MERVSAKMASVESIGSCSLDVEATASESSATVADGQLSSVSQETLLSQNSADNKRPMKDLLSPSNSQLQEISSLVNACNTSKKPDQFPCDSRNSDNIPIHQPSYVSISCSVSGYTSFSCYNSKAREGLRSRDNSPGRMTFASSASSDFVHSGKKDMSEGSTKKSMFLSVRTANYREIKSHSDNGSAINLKQFSHEELGWNSDNNLHLSQVNGVKTDSKFSMEDDHHIETSWGNVKSTKSLVQQRVERLYGPGALAQGFLVHRARPRTPSISSSSERPAVFSQLIKQTSSSINGDRKTAFDSQGRNDHIPVNSTENVQSVQGELKPDLSKKSLSSIENGQSSPLLSCRTDPVAYSNTGGNINHGSTQKPPINVIATQLNIIEDDKRSVQLNKESVTSENHHETGLLDKDGHYFKQLMNVERRKIQDLIECGQRVLGEGHLSEEHSGRFRAAIGKATLLLAQKFEQFRGLCNKNMNQLPDEPFPTTSSDLEGFWDMILIQVHEIYELFRELNLLKDKQWNQLQVSDFDRNMTGQTNGVKPSNSAKPKRSQQKKIPASLSLPRSVKAEAAIKSREEARRQLAEMKRKARNQLLTNQKSEVQDVEIFTPDSKDSS